MPLVDRHFFLSRQRGPVTAVLRGAATADERQRALDTTSAALVVDALGNDGSDTSRYCLLALRELLGSPAVDARRASNLLLRDELPSAVSSGRLLVLDGWHRRAPTRVTAPEETREKINWFPAERPVKPKSWIAITLIDRQGVRVAKARYRVSTRSGAVREGALDSKGEAYVDGLDPGECTVEFPDFAAEDFT